MAPPPADEPVRSAAFAFLSEQARLRGERWPPVLPRSLLEAGFQFGGRRVPLLGPQGIFKPAAVRGTIPLSITTAPPVPQHDALYDDEFGYGHLVYRYRGTNPAHHENAGLRAAMQTQTPLIYFHGIVPGSYLAVWPAYIVGDRPDDLAFTVAFEPGDADQVPEAQLMVEDARRAYAQRVVLQRLHQAGFRERVLAAYKRCCSLCRLRHEPLIDAAHIIPDGRPRGEPVVSNGLALCKLHHAAFDANIIGIRPDRIVEVRRDVLEEIDGPMLLHGLQGVHRTQIWIPRPPQLQPAPDRLEERYEEFRKAV